MKKSLAVLLTAISLATLACGGALAQERINIEPTLEDCRAIPKFEGLFEGEVPEWVLVRNRKCIEMEKNVKGGLEAVKSSLAIKK